MPKRVAKSAGQQLADNVRAYVEADPKRKPKPPKSAQLGGILIGLEEAELVKAALIMRANYIETGTVYMNRNDAVAHNASLKSDKAPYSMLEKHSRPVEIRQLEPEQEKIVAQSRELLGYLNRFF